MIITIIIIIYLLLYNKLDKSYDEYGNRKFNIMD